jgi:predicted DNA-binding ribbon-helix-helix protein
MHRRYSLKRKLYKNYNSLLEDHESSLKEKILELENNKKELENLSSSENVNILNDISLTISHTDDSIRLGDGTNLITSTAVGPKQGLDVNVINDLNVDIDGTTATPSSVLLVGSEDGTTAGTKVIFTCRYIHGTFI